MRTRLLAVCLGISAATISSDTMAAEARDVGKMLNTLPSLQSALRAIAPPSPEGVGAQTARALGLDAGSNLVLKQARPLPNNRGRTLRFDQTFNGVPIFGQQVVVEQDTAGNLVGLDGQAVFDIGTRSAAPPAPALSPQQALQRAKENTSRQAGLVAAPRYENEEAVLVYYLAPDKELKLSYKTSFVTTVVDAGGGIRPTRPVYIIDANTGQTLDFYENIQHGATGTGPGGNRKTKRYLFGTAPLPKFDVNEQGTDCTMDGVDVITENLNHQTAGAQPPTPWKYKCHDNTHKEINEGFAPLNDAHAFGKAVVDMYKDWYGTNPLRFKLHMRVHYGTNFENAFWNGQSMTFGDGKDRFYPLVSLDVAAHEVSHGFTEQNSGLLYREQSGGMNEAFSDMAGKTAEHWFVLKYGRLPGHRPNPDYDIGADIFKQENSALRFMCDPPKDGRSIDHVRDYRGGMDPHFSSGVYNKVFCLLSKRSGWDARKAFGIFVSANQSYWTPMETFQGGAEKVLKATRVLGYPEADVIWAFGQVGIEIAPPMMLRK
ncbi:MAG: M4 family metallopeptidase [Hyphomicrobiaceae bacterium]